MVILAGPGESTFAVAGALARQFPVHALILERKPNGWTLLKRRASRLGALRVFGQLLFIAYARALRRLSGRRIAELRASYDLRQAPPSSVKLIPVESVNDDETIDLLRSLKPKVVVVNGTRIISERVLRAIDAPFINTHAGITPKYRGVHGGYWALASNDPDNAGVTVHLVDPGIDTGGVLYQARITPTQTDNFITLPLMQLGEGLPLLCRAVNDALNGRLSTTTPALPSQLFHHPTLWGYFWLRLTRGVR